MAADIYQKIELDFGEQANQVRALLAELNARSKGMIEDRLIRSMVFLANGKLDYFQAVIELAETDPRDVYWQAEYDGGEVRLRDFTRSFHELGLL